MKTVALIMFALATALRLNAATTVWPASTNANQTFFGVNTFTQPINGSVTGSSSTSASATSAGTVPATGVTTNGGYGVFGTGAFSPAGGGGGSPPTFSPQFSQDWNGTQTNIASGAPLTNPVVWIGPNLPAHQQLFKEIPGSMGLAVDDTDAPGWYFSGDVRTDGNLYGIGQNITSLNPANIAAGTAAISISGTAALATAPVLSGNAASQLLSVGTGGFTTNAADANVATLNISVPAGHGSSGTNAFEVGTWAQSKLFQISTNGDVYVSRNTGGSLGAIRAGTYLELGVGLVDTLELSAGALIPKADAAVDLGALTKRYKTIWVTNIVITGSGGLSSSGAVLSPTLTATNAITLQGTNAAPTGVTWGVTVPDLWLTVTNNGVQGFVPWFKNH